MRVYIRCEGKIAGILFFSEEKNNMVDDFDAKIQIEIRNEEVSGKLNIAELF